MKKLGLIGGIGPESSIVYYRMIIQEFQKKTGSKDYPEILINSINMTEMLSYVFQNRLDELVDFLIKKIEPLKKSGIEFCAIASNTPHIVYEEIASKINIPIISIVEETCKEIQKKGIKKVGLIGTISTMSNGFYQKVAKKSGIEIIIPEPLNQDYIHEKYMSELVFNKIIPDTKTRLIEIVNDLKNKANIQGLILGGTELPFILCQKDFINIDILDTTKIHVEAIVAEMIEK